MKKSFLFLHMAILLAGITGIFGKLIELNEVLITFYRMLLASVILIGMHQFTKTQTEPQKYSRLELLKIGSVGLILGLHLIFFYASIKYSNISIGVVCFCLAGFFTAILEPLIHKKKPSILEILLSCITLVGIGLIFSFDTKFRVGIYLGTISSFLVALFTIFNEGLTQKYDSKTLTKIEMIGGTLGIGLLLPWISSYYPMDSWIPTTTDLAYLILLSAVCTVLLYVLLNIALRQISAFTVNLSFNLEPIYAIWIAIFYFDEYQELNRNFFIGLAIIFCSLLIQMFRVFKSKS